MIDLSSQAFFLQCISRLCAEMINEYPNHGWVMADLLLISANTTLDNKLSLLIFDYIYGLESDYKKVILDVIMSPQVEILLKVDSQNK